MLCPMCGAANGDAVAIAARGYQCIDCKQWPNSTWWHREEERRIAAEKHERLELPETFERCRVGERVATDAFGEDFEAEHDGQRVVLRVFRRWVGDTPELGARFRRLVSLRRGLAVPTVVPLVDAGAHDGLLYIATERVDAPRLASMLGPPMGWPQTLAIVGQLAAACHAAHQVGVVTGIVPEQVFVGERVQMDVYRHVLNRDEPADRLDYASDVYALGLLACELATGQCTLLDDVPGPIARALDRDRSRRFTDAAAFAAAIAS